MNKDFMGIVLEVGESGKNKELSRLYEDVKDGNFVDMSVYNIPLVSIDESASEPLNYQGLKTVKEKFGRGVSLTKGGTEFRFVSDKYSTDELERRIGYILEHQDSEQAQSWLRSNTLCYLRQSVNGEDRNSINLFESTQSKDVATKTDSASLNSVPKVGVAYEFEDGVFVVDEIVDDTVYLIGPDDEYYSISKTDFEKEVISSLDEAELDYESSVEKEINKVFSGWAIEKVNSDTNKTGIVMYAVSNGKDDIVVFVHLGEETYEVYSESDDKAPDLEGSLDKLGGALSKMVKYFK